MTLTCSATGGKPLAKVSWWRDGKVVTDECQYFPDRKKSQSVLKIEKLSRSHLLAVYSCEVSNSNLQPPLVVRVAVDMYLRPLEVNLIKDHSELSAGKRYNISCRCRGSRPPAVITWWKDGVSLEGGTISVSADGNTTTSTLSFTPTSADHGLVLSCKASNHRIPFSEQQRTWMLRVLYPPKVTMTLGHGLDATDIKEGADVYFECHLIANPWVHRVWWLRDGERLLSNATSGIIVSNQTLVLQGVSRLSSGRYCCEATNKEGTTKSTPFHLKVKFEPICGDGTGRKVLGAAKDEPLRVECRVEAEPTAKLFRWSFNSTPGISRELTEFSSDEGGSVLTYVPKIAADYGTLQCWGQNDIGAQQQPCTYHIVPAGKPDPPHTCQLTNVTHHSVVLSCKKGFDGGLKQRFIMVLTSSDTLVANMSSTTVPDFRLTNLEPAQEYSITVSSFNSKGWSKNGDSIIFKTLPAPGLNEQRRLMEASRGEHNRTGPWLYITLAAGSTLIIAGTVGVIIFAVRRFRNENETKIVTDVKLLDWQACYFGSPVLDLSYALYSGCSKETLDKFPDLLKIYHDTLLLSLSKLGCQSSRPYPFEIFKEEWPRFCQFGVILGILVTKIKLTDMAVLPDPADVDTKDNSNYFEELVLAKEECDVPELLKRIDYIFEHLRKIGGEPCKGPRGPTQPQTATVRGAAPGSSRSTPVHRRPD